MAKTKRTYPTGKFYLKVPAVPKNTEQYPIYIQYTWNRNILKKATGIKCKATDWNATGNNGKGEFKSSHGNTYKHENNKLQALLQKYDSLIYDYVQQHPHQLTTDIVRDLLNDKPLTRKDGGRGFVDYTLSMLENEYSRNRIKISRFNNGKSAMNIFSEFLRTKEIERLYIGDVTTDLLDEYIRWRRNIKHNCDETINHSLTPVIKAAKKAADEGLMEKTISSAISEMRITIKPKLDTDNESDVKFLTKEEIISLAEYYSSCEQPRRKEYIEMFFFAYHACGLRCIDIMTLRWADIDLSKKELKKIMVKTLKRVTVPLTEQALAILHKWEGRNEKYVFGLLANDFNLDDDTKLYNRRNSVEQMINQSLKVVGENLHFSSPLTMHVARHSFAVHALNDGLSMTVVGRLLGHSSTEITEKVYAQFSPETLSDEVAKLHLRGLFNSEI